MSKPALLEVEGIEFYSHWGGAAVLEKSVRHILDVGMRRLDDIPYLRRIAAWEIVRHLGGQTGGGIGAGEYQRLAGVGSYVPVVVIKASTIRLMVDGDHQVFALDEAGLKAVASELRELEAIARDEEEADLQ